YNPTDPSQTPSTADSALFWGPAGGVMLLAREGDQVSCLPDLPVYGQQNFSNQFDVIGGNGAVLFTTSLVIGSGVPAVTSANDTVMLTGYPGALSVVCREGSVLPTGEVVIPVSGSTMSFINQINEAGVVLHELRFSTAAPSTATS